MKDIEKQIRNLLEEALETRYKKYYRTKTKRDSLKINKYYKHPNTFFLGANEKDLEKLDYTASKSHYTNKYVEELKSILGDPEAFYKLDKQERLKVQSVLDSLANREYEWNSRIKRGINDPAIVNTIYENVTLHYSRLLDPYLEPKKEMLLTQRANRKFFSFKSLELIKGVSSGILEEENNKGTKLYPSFIKLSTLKEEDMKIIIRDYIGPSDIFALIMKIITKHANDNLFTNTEKIETKQNVFLDSILADEKDVYLTEDRLVVEKHKIVREFSVSFAVMLMNAALSHVLNEKDDLKALGRPVINYIKYPRKSYKNSNWWNLHLDNSSTLVSALEDINFLSAIVTKQDNNRDNYRTHKKIIQYVLPASLNVTAYTQTHLPKLVAPKNLSNETFLSNVRKIVRGEQSITVSDQLLKTINTSQRRKFVINEAYLHILNSLMSKDKKYSDIRKAIKAKLPFTIHEDIVKKEHELESTLFSKKLTPTKNLLLNELKSTLEGHQLSMNSLNQLSICGFTNMDTTLYKIRKDKSRDLRTSKLIRKYYKTAIEISKILAGFDLYITNLFCCRLRLYPKEYLVSRTSGALKHLLCEQKPLKMTLNGIKHLFKAYYSFFPEVLLKFDTFLANTNISKRTGKKVLYAFFNENPVSISESENPLYVMLLHSEILQVEKTGTSSINIEIDQTASGMVFLSYVLKNRQLGEQCNLLSRKLVSPYEYCMSKFSEFYHSTINGKEMFPSEYKNDVILKFFCTDKKVHKYALMCFSYSQKQFGRMIDFSKRFKELKTLNPNEAEYKTLQRFANVYEDFMDFCFKDLNKQIRLLEKIVMFVLNETRKTGIITLEGDKLEWSFHKSSRRIRKYLDLKTLKARPYSVQVPLIDLNDLPLIDKRRHVNCFLSYLIHSIDASVMRLIMEEMYRKTSYKINHLHDCVILHPNYADDFFDIVESLYTSQKMHNLTETLFDGFIGLVSLSSRDQIKLYYEEFSNNATPFKVKKDCFKPDNLYKYES